MRNLLRYGLAGLLVFTGVNHFTRLDDLMTLVPAWLPERDKIVWVTGAIEIAFAVALIVPMNNRKPVGYALAAFLLVIWAGNIHQAVTRLDTLGLDSDVKRIARLPFQPLLILWALWVTRAWPFGRTSEDVVAPE